MDGTPKRTGQVINICLTGYLFFHCDDDPLILNIPDSPDPYLPVFSSKDKLVTFLGDEVDDQSIARITNEVDFLESIPGKVKIMVDLHITPEGGSQWTEVLRD